VTESIRIGVMGNNMGRNHARAALQAETTTLAAIADPKDEMIERFWPYAGLTPGDVPIYDDYRTMIDQGDLDAVVNALPTGMHAEASLYALEHGLHVMCEKPPTVNAAEMIEVADAAKSRRLTYMFARQNRFGPDLREARELVQEGSLGRVYHAESRWMRARFIPFRGGWGVNKDAGGGVLLDLGVHQVDDAWFAMGCPEPVSVFAAMHCGMSNLAPDDLSMPYNADDATVGLIRFVNGASLSFLVTFALNIDWHEGYLDLTKPREKPLWRELRLYGDRAGIDVQKHKLIEGDVTGIFARNYQPRPDFTRYPNVFIAQISEFARAIVDGNAPLNPADQAVTLMKILDAVKASAETGAMVEIK